MKNGILLSALFLLVGCKAGSTKAIGKVDKNDFVIANVAEIQKEWNAILLENNIKSSLATFQIKKGLDEKTKENYYILYAISKNNTVKMARQLFLKNKQFYFSAEEVRYIVCHGCVNSYPVLYDKKWSCDTDLSDDCKKTEIIKF